MVKQNVYVFFFGIFSTILINLPMNHTKEGRENYYSQLNDSSYNSDIFVFISF